MQVHKFIVHTAFDLMWLERALEYFLFNYMSTYGNNHVIKTQIEAVIKNMTDKISNGQIISSESFYVDMDKRWFEPIAQSISKNAEKILKMSRLLLILATEMHLRHK